MSALPSWHEARARLVGCSELASVFSARLLAAGERVHKTAWQLWHEKVGSLPPVQDNDAMRLGRIFEAGVLELTAIQTGMTIIPWGDFAPVPTNTDRAAVKARDVTLVLPPGVQALATNQGGRPVAMLVDPAARLCGTPDAIGVQPDGSLVVVDAKTVGVYAMAAWKNEAGEVELPAGYQLQGHGYCALTGLARVCFGALRWPTLTPFWVEANHRNIEAIGKACRSFVASIDEGAEPPIDFLHDADAIGEVYGRETAGRVLDATDAPALTDVLTKLEQVRSDKRALDEQATALAAEALVLIGDAETVRYGDGRKVTAKRTADSPGKIITADMVGTYINARKGTRTLRFGHWRD